MADAAHSGRIAPIYPAGFQLSGGFCFIWNCSIIITGQGRCHGCPRTELQLTYTNPVTLTTEFSLVADGV